MDYAGIDTESIVSQLIALEQRPLTALDTRKRAAENTAVALGKVTSAVEAIRTAAAKLAEVSAYQRFSANVSNPNAVSATAGATAAAGSLSFRITQIAGTHGMRSTAAGLTADSIVADAGALLTIGTKPGEVAIGKLQAGSGGAASITATAAVADAPTTITTDNNKFTLLVDGQSRQVEIAAGDYADRAAVVAAVDSAVRSASGDRVQASVDGSGILTFTADAGVSLGIAGGGSAAALIGVSGGTTASGGDYVYDAGGFQTAFAGTPATGSATVAAAEGSTVIRIASTGDGTLGDVAAAIGSANGAVSAAAVQTTTGWTLQLTSKVSGTAGAISIGAGVFGAALGGWADTGTATDAVIVVGAGTPGEYSITGDGDTFADVLPGVSFTATAVTADDVTITVGRNDAAIAADVSALVDKINALIADVKVQTYFNQETKVGGPLIGESSVRRLAGELRNAVNEVVGDYATGLLPSSVGIELQKDGTFKFDQAKFSAALAADPDKLTELFVGTDAVPGIAARLEQTATDMTRASTGLLTSASDAVTGRIRRFTEQMDKLEDRLVIREANLYRQYSALQTMLAGMQNQGTWLEGQLATLSNNWGG